MIKFVSQLHRKPKSNLSTLVEEYACGVGQSRTCFCDIDHRRNRCSHISNQGYCQISSPSWISDTPQAVFEPAQYLSLGIVEWSCAMLIATTPRSHIYIGYYKSDYYMSTIFFSIICLHTTKRKFKHLFLIQFFISLKSSLKLVLCLFLISSLLTLPVLILSGMAA